MILENACQLTLGNHVRYLIVFTFLVSAGLNHIILFYSIFFLHVSLLHSAKKSRDEDSALSKRSELFTECRHGKEVQRTEFQARPYNYNLNLNRKRKRYNERYHTSSLLILIVVLTYDYSFA